MTTWTLTGRQILEGFLKKYRAGISASGGDADEVEADLRRHVEEEVAALKLSVVTEQDVR